MPRIREIYAFVTDDDYEADAEGVVSWSPRPGVMLPLVAADLDRVNALREYAQEIADSSNRPIRLYKFSRWQQIDQIRPAGSLREPDTKVKR